MAYSISTMIYPLTTLSFGYVIKQLYLKPQDPHPIITKLIMKNNDYKEDTKKIYPHYNFITVVVRMEQTNNERLEHHPSILTRKNTALVVVDMQEKLLPYVIDKEKVVENVQMLIKFADIMAIPIILTEHYPKGLGTTLKNYAPMEKVIFSCCGAEGFISKLKELGIKRIMMAGIESHICVEQTTLDVMHAGFEVHVIADAISSRTKENKKIGIKKMKQFGAIVSSTEMAMYEIMERADTKEFKEVLKLVK
jgi:nicotinamidase-related amidase